MKSLQKIYWLAVVLLMLAVLALPTGPSQAQAAAGFHISGRNLLDANGNNFIMRGVSHAHTWYPSQTSSFANIKATGANTVRVVLSGGRWTKNTASDVANVINLCKANKLICVLENHDTTGYGEDGAAVSLAQAVAYWKEIQSVLTGQEAYIIINIGNEPYGNNNASAWVNATKNAIAELRSAGFEHTIMVDAPNWGQDWSFVMRDNAASIFDSDPDKNLVFSIHMYGVFDTASEVQSYVSTFVSAGLPLVIGEFGHNHSDGNPDEDAIMAQAQANGVGYIGWSWSGNGGGVEYLDMVTSFNPAQLTSWGERIVNGANGIKQTSQEASVYGGPTSTPCANCTLTHTFTPVPPTNTPTVTHTPNVNGALKVQLVTGGTDNNQQSAFHYRVQNTGASAVSNISVRIYFSLDGSQAASKYVLEKYYDQSGVATISGPTQASGSSYYFTVNYGTKSLPAGSAWEYHTSMHLNDWSNNYSGSNDWWHTTGTMPASYVDWTSIPAYVSGSLNWGSEPGGGPTHTPTATGTITRTPTATPSASRTPTPTTCPMATAEPLRVEPVTSPSDQTTQVITVRANNSDSVTVALESGSFTVTGDFTTSNPALVTVSLLPNTEHHLTVSAHIKNFVGPGGCTYGGYTISMRNDRYGMPLTIVQSDVTNPTLTPTPTITPTHTPTQHPGAACAVTYSMNDWGSGFTANVTIANNGSTAINGWTLAWAFPGSQTITNLWSGSYTQSGQSVSVTNLGYNANIPPNGNVNFGFNANYSGANARPAVFSLNGSLCSVNP
ncbi:MAG: cellulase family glycosylhydrolase [Anaerolineae bacterium]|nr:cellulase family glycosylhydrolase [Anaerolineae bacterium]